MTTVIEITNQTANVPGTLKPNDNFLMSFEISNKDATDFTAYYIIKFVLLLVGRANMGTYCFRRDIGTENHCIFNARIGTGMWQQRIKHENI